MAHVNPTPYLLFITASFLPDFYNILQKMTTSLHLLQFSCIVNYDFAALKPIKFSTSYASKCFLAYF